MVPASLNLSIYKGETWTEALRFKQNGSVLPLTGMTMKAQIRPAKNSETLIAEMDCTVTAALGLVELSLTAVETAAMNPGTYQWDLKATDSDDIVKYWVAGQVTVGGRVTV